MASLPPLDMEIQEIPVSPSLYRSKVNVWQLQESMRVTADQFQTFKRAVKFSSLELYHYNLAKEQEPEKWQQCLERVIEKLPWIGIRYPNCWPVEIYFDMMVKNRRNHYNRPTLTFHDPKGWHPPNRPKKIAKVFGDNAQSDTFSASPSTNANKRSAVEESPDRFKTPKRAHREFVGKPPPGLKSSIPLIPRNGDLHPQNNHVSIGIQTQFPYAVHLNDGGHTHHPVVGSQLGVQSPLATTVSDVNIQSGYIITSCIRCGQCPSISSANPCNGAIKHSLGDGKQYLVPILALAGMVEDIHLQIFSKWSEADRQLFLGTFLERISVLDKETLLDKLIYTPKSRPGSKANKDKRQTEGAQSQLPDIILAPTHALMETLSDPDTSLSMLMTPMNLDGDCAPVFYNFIETTEAMSNEFLSGIEHDIVDISQHPQYDKLALALHAKLPILKLFEDDWAVKLYLRRLLNKRHVGASDPDLDQDVKRCIAESYRSAVFDQQSSRVLHHDTNHPIDYDLTTHPIIKNTCDVHGPGIVFSRISPKMESFMRSRRMDELIPILALVGVQQDVHFNDFCALSEERRMGLFEKSSNSLHLNPFQQMMLKVAFKQINFEEKVNH